MEHAKFGPDHFRYVDQLDEDGRVYIACKRYIVFKETPKGYWVVSSDFHMWTDRAIPKREKHFVLKDSRVRFCYPDKRQAFGSYRVRKEWQIAHLKRQLRRAAIALKGTQRIVTDEAAINAIGDWNFGGDKRYEAGDTKRWWQS